MECSKSIRIEQIHSSVEAIETILKAELKDIVPAYHSIAVFTDHSLNAFVTLLEGKKCKKPKDQDSHQPIRLPICYELGMDLARIAKHAGLSADQVIALHLAGVYRSVFLGFTPGFIYADGLDARLDCPRLENPRKHLPEGSVGIGGSQTGIYALASPGGWNIIGRTPEKLFDTKKTPPIRIGLGDRFRFYRISKEEFESWEN